MMRVNLIFCLFLSFSASALDLKKAAVCDGMSENKTEIDLNAARIIEAVYKQNNIDLNASCLGWTNMGAGGVWFEILSDLKVSGINVSTNQYLGSWSLGASDPCENSTDSDCASPWWVGRWGASEYLESEIIERMTDYSITEKYELPYGIKPEDTFACLMKNPLRYGDIENDGKKELVVITPENFIIFSPELKKTTFAFMFNNNDWLLWETMIDESIPSDESSDIPQYGSPKLHKEQEGGIGYRGYAKIYAGGFEAENTKDVLVWRKFYQSKLKNDPVKGFEKIRDTFIHYKLINGEYQKQPTEQSVIQGWLEAKNLTWQKGYPSKSECAGQEGQLIPEMHDPLLNDPDVLK